MKGLLSNSRGVTLIELMMAILFLTIAGAAVYFMFVHGQELINEQYQRRRVLEKAQEKMERLKFLERYLGNVPDSENKSGKDTIMAALNEEGAPLVANYEVVVRHSPTLDGNGRPVYDSVAVSYDWKAFSGRRYNIVLSTKY